MSAAETRDTLHKRRVEEVCNAVATWKQRQRKNPDVDGCLTYIAVAADADTLGRFSRPIPVWRQGDEGPAVLLFGWWLTPQEAFNGKVPAALLQRRRGRKRIVAYALSILDEERERSEKEAAAQELKELRERFKGRAA